MYYRRPRRNRAKNYFMPFAVIAVIFITLFFGWKSVNKRIINQSSHTLSEKVFLSIDSGSAKAMTVGREEWQNAPDKIYLYKGEKIKTASDGRASLTFFDGSEARLNTSSEIEFTALKKKNETNTIAASLNAGETWININRINNPDSTFKVSTPLLNIETRGATYAIEYPGSIYVLDGSLQVEVKYNDSVVESYNVGVGQQMIIDEAKAEAVKKGEDTEIIFALSESFKGSNWYEWNQMKDEGVSELSENQQSDEEADEKDLPTENTDEESQNNIDESDETDEQTGLNSEILTITKPENNAAVSKNSIAIEGRSNNSVNSVKIGEKSTTPNNNKWAATINLEEGQNTIKVTALDNDGNELDSQTVKISYDTEAPDAPVVTSPEINNDEPFALDDVEQVIEGTVSSDTQAVIINDYRLTQYVPGSKQFKYFAKTSYNNLKIGKNEYKIIAEDKAGNQSDPTIIYLELKAETVEELANDEAENESEAESTPSAANTGGVQFTAPNNGENLVSNDTEFELSGTVPEGTTKVTVNDYELTQFSEGDSNFTYRAYVSIGNLKIGEVNTFTAKAYNSNDELLGQATMSIDVESGSQAAPEINIPSSQDEYTTNLDTVVVGGKVGKWVTRIYINEKEITDYIPGSENFRTSVNLTEGENNFTVKAEKSGEPAGEDFIKIIYQP